VSTGSGAFDPRRVERGFRPLEGGKLARATQGMVSAASPQATRAGIAALEAGGNAADAACAAALALCVCEPQACGLGGQSMVLAHMGGRTFTLDGSGPVPRGFPHGNAGPVEPNGYGATTVPTTLATLGHLHRRWGRLPWHTVVEPSVALARDGFRITALQRALQIREQDLFASVNGGSGARYFLKEPGVPFDEGDIFRQPELAGLLRSVGAQGPEAFYTGAVAAAVDADMRAHGGYLQAEDLAAIPWPVERGVVEGTYRTARIVSAPPPMGGRLLLFVLNVLDRVQPEVASAPEWPTWRLLAALFRTALRHRHTPPFAPDDYDSSVDPLLSDQVFIQATLDTLLAEFHGEDPGGPRPPATPDEDEARRAYTSPKGPLRPVTPDTGETTHLSVMDGRGNVVGITQSVNMVYGSKAAAAGLGFLYNNYLLDTDTTDPRNPHFLKPGNKPWSSACPTLVCWDGKPWLLAGSPGSDRIISTVTQFLVHTMDGGCGLAEAVDRPRLHCTSDGVVSLEADRFPPGTVEAFRRAGYPVVPRDAYAFYHGAIHAVLREVDSGAFQGVAEFRRDGEAGGPRPPRTV
jgi:gamma-glutamyltranspeptidase / glutathione hydrolase